MRTARSLAAVLCCLSCSLALALECRVLGPDGKPVAGARVQVLGRPGTTVSDRDGRFTLPGQPQPPFDVLVSLPDGVAVRPIPVDALPETGPLELHTELAFADEVTIVSVAAADLDLPPAAAFTLAGRADIVQRAPQNLADVTENIPGAGKVGDDHAAVPTLRGLSAGRTLILLDDGRVTAERRAGPSATFLDPSTIGEVEVVRGPGSVAYGSDAFGGVIRARTHIPAPGEPTTVRYNLAGASNVGERAANVEVGTNVLGGGLALGASYREFDDYTDGNGDEVVNSSAEFKGFRLGWQRDVAGGNLRVLWRSDLARDVGKPAVDSDVSQTFYPEEDSHRLALHYDRPGPGDWSRLSIAATWDSYRLLTDRDRFATATTGRQYTSADVDANDYGLRLEAERPIGATRLLLGVDASGRYGLAAVNDTSKYGLDGSLTSFVHEVSIESARRDDLGAFVALNGSLGIVSLSMGLRGDQVKSENSGGYFGDRDTSNSSLSGFAAATFALTDGLELALQGAHGFRDALLSDRYYRGISGRGFITGNPDLESETSNQLDVALRYRGESWQLALYGYLYRIDDLIERYKSGDNYYFRNRGEAEMKGVELEGSLALSPRVTLQGGLQLPHGEIRDDGRPTDGVPADGGFVVIRQELSPSWWWLARVASYTRDSNAGPTEQEIPGYTLFDAGVGYRLSELLELQLYGRNLTDRAYSSSADSAAVLAPGRSVQLALRGTI
ncbi:MAG: TonB-dependent receptor [Acidobacteria bacterium]|nr:TonB-dependent receptor [Acidobacteriota bacterium]